MNATEPTNAAVQALIDQASRRKESPFDFIIVGSGAGGGPLACRLALAGKRVLLIEAGQDPKSVGAVHDAPGYHAASTENAEMSWQFSVRASGFQFRMRNSTMRHFIARRTTARKFATCRTAESN